MSNVEQYFKDLQGIVFDDEKWAQAPCTQILDPDAWFEMDADFSVDELYRLKVVLNTCNSCPLRSDCLEIGMDDENLYFGIWGGLFPAERLVLAGRGRLSIVKRMLSSSNKLRLRTGIAAPTKGDSNE